MLAERAEEVVEGGDHEVWGVEGDVVVGAGDFDDLRVRDQLADAGDVLGREVGAQLGADVKCRSGDPGE